jgi:iron complex outermembrane receptor protein
MKTRLVSMICGLLFIPLATFSQTKLEGRVTDETGQPVIGAKIEVQESFLRTIADEEGYYKLTKLQVGPIRIKVSSMGLEAVEKEVIIGGGGNKMDFTLRAAPQEIMEMVVYQPVNFKTPTTYTELKTEDIEKSNFGQDLPMLLRFTPSAVVTSDAGAGVGYTGIRIRGVDPTRTNVTVNGIPLNDSESHGVFWVNMPDFSSSADGIQIQRGVGTSANGASAFGASINVNTNKTNKKAYGVIDNGFGSFNTWRHTVKAGTGLINDKFTVDARLSKIASDGYIDRATSDLKSFYLAASWLGKKSTLTANIFSGQERTYQAWNGVPESAVNGDQNEIQAYADRNGVSDADLESLKSSGRRYNAYTYENEVDNYQQDHYQLHFSHFLSDKLTLKVKGHYTRGRGYFEQFRADDSLSTYGLDPIIVAVSAPPLFLLDTVTTGDFIRRRWLDNHFYGGIYALNYKNKGFDITLGGGANQYLGAHFGEVIWAEYASNGEIRDNYYDNDGVKSEIQSYLKGTYKRNKFTYYADFQFRYINYQYLGIDEVNGELEDITQSATYNFFNPKAGVMYDFNNRNNVYASVAIANREPVRSDFRENTAENRPEHEQLLNVEAGYRYKGRKLMANVNGYFMNYKNQLVLTGQLNDVGGSTRTNVDKSYRAGAEVEVGYMILKNLSVTGNATYSQNKIKSFTEYDVNYDFWPATIVETDHTNTDLAFSPNLVAALSLNYEPIAGLVVGVSSKYVSDQYLDNTSSESRKIDQYYFTNFQVSYTLKEVLFREITLGVQVNNAFNHLYENNGYTFGFISGGERITENFYYPQAGTNIMTRLTIKL